MTDGAENRAGERRVENRGGRIERLARVLGSERLDLDIKIFLEGVGDGFLERERFAGGGSSLGAGRREWGEEGEREEGGSEMA